MAESENFTNKFVLKSKNICPNKEEWYPKINLAIKKNKVCFFYFKITDTYHLRRFEYWYYSKLLKYTGQNFYLNLFFRKTKWPDPSGCLNYQIFTRWRLFSGKQLNNMYIIASLILQIEYKTYLS